MKKLRLPALLLALILLFSLTACTQEEATDPTSTPEITEAPTQEPSAAPTQEPEESEAPDSTDPDSLVRLAVLSGPTGVGAAKLLDYVDNGPLDSLHTRYEYTISNDNSELVAGLTSGELDIATMASNMAVNLYNKTDGGVKIIAVGTLGVLNILEGGGNSDINSIADLAGRTIYSAGQGANPEYILRYLLQANDVADDVEVVFADASEISAKLLAGEIECAMLPVPAATAAIAKGEGQVRAAIDVTDAWDALQSGSQLVMTAVVARTDFVEAHPEQVEAFLTDYEASISFVNEASDEAAEIIAAHGLTPSAGIAKLAIPQCHLVYLAGVDMVASISDYYATLYSIDPAAVGGALPDDGIYWMGR